MAEQRQVSISEPRSLHDQGHIYVGQIDHVPVELLLEGERMGRLLELGDGFALLGQHLQTLDGPHRHEQAAELHVGGGQGQALHGHHAGLWFALYHTQVLLVGHEAASAQAASHTSASPMQDHLLGRVDALDAPDARGAGRVNVGTPGQVGLRLKGAFGQRHLADWLLPHVGQGEPLCWGLSREEAVALAAPSGQLDDPNFGADVRPVPAATAAGPVHNCPLGTRLAVRGSALQDSCAYGLWGGWPIPLIRLHLRDSVLGRTQGCSAGRSNVLEWLGLRSLTLAGCCRQQRVGGFGLVAGAVWDLSQ